MVEQQIIYVRFLPEKCSKAAKKLKATVVSSVKALENKHVIWLNHFFSFFLKMVYLFF